MADSYQQGRIDGIRLFGEVCGREGGCYSCPIQQIRGTGMTCQDFAAKFPAKMLSLLNELREKEHTYFNEYCIRFPNSDMDVETLAAFSCRKALFEGYLECPGADGGFDCVACWNQKYEGDITVADENEASTDANGVVNEAFLSD